MPLELRADRYRFGVSMNAIDMQRALLRHTHSLPNTPDVEEQAERLRASDFSLRAAEQFSKLVCKWGGYSGIAGRMLKTLRERGDQEDLPVALRTADAALAEEGGVRAALEAMIALPELGISFASKHLRMLAPNRAVVFDSFVRDGLGYEDDADGYVSFLEDCMHVRDHLNGTRVRNPTRPGTGWYVADVEAAIFARLRGF